MMYQRALCSTRTHVSIHQSTSDGAARKFHWFGGRQSPVGSRDKTPIVGLGYEVPQKVKQFADIVYKF